MTQATKDRTAEFRATSACWICGAGEMRPVASAVFELREYRKQDPELAAYSGAWVDLVRCGGCGFAQPASLPALPDYFARMYDQRWPRDWMAGEFRSKAKDFIFRGILRALEARVGPGRRTLLDVGAHVGRFVHLAARAGWRAEGVELNPGTCAFAAEATGLPVHRADCRALAGQGRRFGAATLTDVLEHVPEPVAALEAVRSVLAPDGWLAVKVPHGPNQVRKENLRGRLLRGYRPTVADNLVHVSHFTPRSLAMALERAGFTDVEVRAGAPELARGPGDAAVLAVYGAARLLGPDSPASLNLQAFARHPA